MDKNPKKIEVISGNGKNLDISDVSTHLTNVKPKIKNSDNKKQEIVIPKTKKIDDKK